MYQIKGTQLMFDENDIDKQAQREGYALLHAPSPFFVIRNHIKYTLRGKSHNLLPRKMSVKVLNELIKELKTQ